ncbi:MAG: cupin domain-containing protein, partial [Thermodesulfobacteriota bacterium]|nr:cupin domain-containing protein [Thermodesulfobacteriota bacterium]
MKRKYYKEPDSVILDLPGAKDISLRVIIGHEDGAPNFTMLLLEIAPGGHGPSHTHPWEEIIFVKSGTGEVKSGDETRPLGPGTAVFFAPNEPHQFLNTGTELLEFL